ncbi:transcription antitermination factor NusB [Atopobiaceae bacterium 24-176]
MSKSPLHGRLLARAQALQVLFQAEATGRPVDRILDDEYVVTDGPIDDYGRELALAVYDRRDDLDLVLGTVARNWSVGRMASVDRNILRIALYELLYEEAIGDAIAIDEAVRLSKIFGGDDSFSFVNGVLGRLQRDRTSGVDIVARAKEQRAAKEAAARAEAERAAAEAAESELAAEAQDAADADADVAGA